MITSLQVALGIIMAIVALMQLTVLIGFRTGKFTAATESTARELVRRLDGCDARLERANIESSRLAGQVQGLIGQMHQLPEDLRQIFVSRETMELHLDQWKQDREALWQAMGDRRRKV